MRPPSLSLSVCTPFASQFPDNLRSPVPHMLCVFVCVCVCMGGRRGAVITFRRGANSVPRTNLNLSLTYLWVGLPPALGALVSCFLEHCRTVGLLSEFAPSMQTGLVGVTGGCLLGFNKNRGQEISLRLRTDDFMGTYGNFDIILGPSVAHSQLQPSPVLSGCHGLIRARHFLCVIVVHANWELIGAWNPTLRRQASGTIT